MRTHGSKLADRVLAGGWQFVLHLDKAPRQLVKDRVIWVSVHSIVGDPDLYMSIAEPPTEKEYVWKSVLEGADLIQATTPRTYSPIPFLTLRYSSIPSSTLQPPRRRLRCRRFRARLGAPARRNGERRRWLICRKVGRKGVAVGRRC